MARRSNLTATRATVRALRRAERLGAETDAWVALAVTTAAALDATVASSDKAYSVALMARAHRDALAALYDHATAYGPPDHWDLLLAEITTPTPGTPDDGGTPRMG